MIVVKWCGLCTRSRRAFLNKYFIVAFGGDTAEYESAKSLRLGHISAVAGVMNKFSSHKGPSW